VRQVGHHTVDQIGQHEVEHGRRRTQHRQPSRRSVAAISLST
jgi:hypothetical protein